MWIHGVRPIVGGAASRRDAVGAHATLRQAGHQPTEASQRTMLHTLVRGPMLRHPRDAVTPCYEPDAEVLRDTPSARVWSSAMPNACSAPPGRDMAVVLAHLGGSTPATTGCRCTEGLAILPIVQHRVRPRTRIAREPRGRSRGKRDARLRPGVQPAASTSTQRPAAVPCSLFPVPVFPSYDAGLETSRWKPGFPRSGAHVGSTRRTLTETSDGIDSRYASRLTAASVSPTSISTNA